MENYRPISLINNFAKLFEKCLKTRIIQFLETNKLLNQHQYGFRTNLSTEDAVFNLINEINNNLNSNRKTLAVFIDLAKAFDTIPHEQLLYRMENMGMRGTTNSLFKNYLSDRTQRVKIEDHYSNPQKLTIGVPQGTVLGPLLFLIYINEIGTILNNAVVISYADDTVVVFNEMDWDRVFTSAENELKELYNWLNYSLLSLNVKKTKYIAFSVSEVDRPINKNLRIHHEKCLDHNNCQCEIIKNVENIKYLGVIVDNHLRWNEHAYYINKKIRNLLYRFYQLREILNAKMIRTIYMSLVESVLRYCLIVWGGCFKNALKNIMVTQNYALKIIYKKEPTYSTDSLYKEANILPLRALFVHSCLIYLPKIKYLLTDNTVDYNLRTESLRTPLYTKAHTQRIVTYFAPKFFNRLPPNIKSTIYNKKKYNVMTKKYIQEHYATFLELI